MNTNKDLENKFVVTQKIVILNDENKILSLRRSSRVLR
jgi:hypothetical protein